MSSKLPPRRVAFGACEAEPPAVEVRSYTADSDKRRPVPKRRPAQELLILGVTKPQSVEDTQPVDMDNLSDIHDNKSVLEADSVEVEEDWDREMWIERQRAAWAEWNL